MLVLSLQTTTFAILTPSTYRDANRLELRICPWDNIDLLGASIAEELYKCHTNNFNVRILCHSDQNLCMI